MKLRNKKTGGKLEWDGDLALCNRGKYGESLEEDHYNSLTDLCADWEDYEEPKEDYIRVIESFIHYVEEADGSFCCDESVKKFVEKLKAWKRLKDAGFEFKGWKVLDHDSPRIYFNVYRKNSDDIVPFLDLLFGGEE